jgi:hypothetical protein
MSWSGVGTLCVACQEQDGKPWLIMYDVEKDKIRTLFPWTNDLQSFVVGPRMVWNKKEGSTYKSNF